MPNANKNKTFGAGKTGSSSNSGNSNNGGKKRQYKTMYDPNSNKFKNAQKYVPILYTWHEKSVNDNVTIPLCNILVNKERYPDLYIKDPKGDEKKEKAIFQKSLFGLKLFKDINSQYDIADLISKIFNIGYRVLNEEELLSKKGKEAVNEIKDVEDLLKFVSRAYKVQAYYKGSSVKEEWADRDLKEDEVIK